MPLELRGLDLGPIYEDAGMYSLGVAVTATLRVSPNGDNSDGSSWTRAYRTIQAALDAASTDQDDCTLIMVSPHTSNYNINRAGDPTWSANVILHGAYRNWAKVKNSHAAALSIMKLTGKAAVVNLNLNLGRVTNGLIMTHGGVRVLNCQFVGEDLTAARTALHLDHVSGGKHAAVKDCDFLANGASYMTAIKIDRFGWSYFERLTIHNCATAIQIVGANSDKNSFNICDLGDNDIGLDFDAGSEQHVSNITMHHNTTNIDDTVGDSILNNIFGFFEVTIEPNNLVGVQVNAGGAGVYGVDTQIRAGATSTRPFRIVGVILEPSASEWYQVRFSADSGVTFYDIVQFDANKREGVAASSGTEFIFNQGTRISASVRSITGGNNVRVWLEIQEI